jgi:hypothetical protein
MTRLQKGLLAGAVVVALAVGSYLWAGGGVESADRIFVNSVVVGFMGVRSDLESRLKSGQEMGDQTALTEKWRKANGNVAGVNRLYFEKDGSVLAISDDFGIVVVIRPLEVSSSKWDCRTYPRTSYRSLCSKLAADNKPT